MASTNNEGGSDRGTTPPAERYGEPLAAGVLESPAAERNKKPILDVLQRLLPRAGTILEVASGTGQHVVHFARAMPGLTWQPSDPDGDLLDVIGLRLRAEPLENVRAPLRLDVRDMPWPVTQADAVLCINMIHIAPWAAADALLQGASSLLASGSLLILYGPYKIHGQHTAPSNQAFDASLRARDAAWGVRDLDEVTELARRYGFAFSERIDMPANNLMVVFRKG